MINKGFFEQAVEVAAEKGITVEDVYEIFKKSLVNSYKKVYGNTSCKVTINPEKHEILLIGIRKVVSEYTVDKDPEEPEEILLEDAKKIKASYKVGDIVEQQINFKNFGRTAVQASKSVCTQEIKSKQRQLAYEHFKELENEMVTGEVTNITEKFVSVDLGFGVTTILPKTELLPNDHPKLGDKLRVYIKRVEQTSKDPRITISRSDKNLVTRLLETNIPEIREGIIEVKGLARDPGDRCKIAVFSNDPNIDAIGSCVGEGGYRTKEIVNALGGEKIDFYKWSEDPVELITNSLQPANVTKVYSIDEENKSSVVIVPDEHLSLAIGKSGQNVRLAVQSCGWKIDIMPVSEAYERDLLIK